MIRKFIFNSRKNDLRYNSLCDIPINEETGSYYKKQKTNIDPIEYVPKNEEE